MNAHVELDPSKNGVAICPSDGYREISGNLAQGTGGYYYKLCVQFPTIANSSLLTNQTGIGTLL